MIPEEGVLLLVNKPLTWSSFDVVKKLKFALRPKKIGHAGTLDPLATGLLVIGVNKFTKKLNELQGLDKTYTGIIEVGKTTPSYDLETDFDSETDISSLEEQQILGAAQKFLGLIDQKPPVYSAIKVNGERSYKKARRNESVELKTRQVTIHQFEISKIDLPEIHFEISCSKGTYIRSLAHDFGQELGVGAHLKKLVRTSVGDYRLSEALELEEVIEKFGAE